MLVDFWYHDNFIRNTFSHLIFKNYTYTFYKIMIPYRNSNKTTTIPNIRLVI